METTLVSSVEIFAVEVLLKTSHDVPALCS